MFDSLKKAELEAVAVMFGVEVSASDTKPEMLNKIKNDGVTWQMYIEEKEKLEGFKDALKEEKKEVVSQGPKALMKMTRANPTYEVRGTVFTRSHPFALVDEDDAAWIAEHEQGIRYATPKEVAEFYS